MRRIEPPDSHYLSAAVGWLELGNAHESAAELDRITPEFRDHPDVLTVRQEIFAKAGQWDCAAELAGKLIKLKPKQAHVWISYAYATRRKSGGGIIEAKGILLDAEKRFPKDALIRYNLACYECQLDNISAARMWLEKAFRLGDIRQLKSMALEDPDLKPLREVIAEMA